MDGISDIRPQAKANELQKERPLQLIIGSPVCDVHPTSESVAVESVRSEAKRHVELMCEIYAEQARRPDGSFTGTLLKRPHGTQRR